MPRTSQLELAKPKDRLKSDACAILSYHRPAALISSGKIERRLRKLKGIREITINHLSHTVKLRYDPNVVTVEKMRVILKKLGSRGGL